MTSRRALLRLLALGGPAVSGVSRARPAAAPPGPCDVSPMDLQAEWRSAAHGIDTRRPRFAWALAPRDPQLRVLGQGAWQVIVARSAAAIGAGRGDVWNSGR